MTKKRLIAAMVAVGHQVSAVADVVINEIHYNPADNIARTEFVELHNPGGQPINMSHWTLSEGVAYTFPEGTQIEAGEYLVVGEDPAALSLRYGVVGVLGPWGGRLDGEGDHVVLRDAGGHKQDEVTYRPSFPWPVRAGGGGSSMELLNPGLDNDLGGSWRSGVLAGDGQGPVGYVPPASIWRYRKGTSEASDPVDAWRFGRFDDSGWSVGQTPVGYGDSDDNTVLSDMRNGYTSVYLRKDVDLSSQAIPASLRLRVYTDDGAVVWINGQEMGRWFVEDGFLSYNGTAGDHEAAWVETIIDGSVLVAGTNILAVHALNRTADSSDFSIDVALEPMTAGVGDGATPGTLNSVYSDESPPQVRQVNTFPDRPASADLVLLTAKVTDPDGVAAVVARYQVVPPGDYMPAVLPLSKSALEANADQPRAPNPSFEDPAHWTEVPMRDDGTNGDAVAGDDTYSVRLPPRGHRYLVRYRIEVEDDPGASVRVPYDDDPSLNFAYFVYDGVPSYQVPGSVHPNAGPAYTYSSTVLTNLPVYHLLTRKPDYLACLAYDGAEQIDQGNEPARTAYNWEGAFVYDGRVYDHIGYRLRGANGRYHLAAKRSMKFRFHRGSYLEVRDQKGRKYRQTWRILTTSKMFGNRLTGPFGTKPEVGNYGLVDQVNGILFERFGVPAPRTHWFHYRVVDEAAEAPDPWRGDFQGLGLAQERYDVRFLEARDLPKGNLYKLTNQRSGTTQLRYQWPDGVSDASDWENIRYNLTAGQSDSWLRTYVNWDVWYRYTAVEEALRHYDYWPDADKNMAYYFAPSANPLGQLWQLPFDYDATWGPTWNDGVDRPQQAMGSRSSFTDELNNVVREFRDLVWQEDQVTPLIRDYADLVREMAYADRDRWASVPPSYRADHGQRDFGDMDAKADDMPLFAFVGNLSYPGGGVPAGGRAAFLDAFCADARIPHRPVVSSLGPPTFPVDQVILGSSPFSDPNGDGTFGAMAYRLAEIHAAEEPVDVRTEDRKLEIRADWESGDLPTFTASMAVPRAFLRKGGRYRARVRHQDQGGLWSRWSEPLEFVASAAVISNRFDGLVLSEIHYHPADLDNDGEFLEFYNAGPEPLDLSGVAISTGVDFTFPLGTALPAGGYTVVVADQDRFTDRYLDPASAYWVPGGVSMAGTFENSLANGGEELTVQAGDQILFQFGYRDGYPWPGRPDGMGPSLELASPVAGPPPDKQAFLADGRNWRSTHEIHGTPGYTGIAPSPVVINELLSHTDLAVGDWLELHNRSTEAVDISGWFLSDDIAQPLKVPIPAGTTIPGSGYVSFSTNDWAGVFAFSELGEEAVLSIGSSGSATVIIDRKDFDAAESERPFGRHIRSDGEADFPAMRWPSRGLANPYPRVGPVVVSEIMFHPVDRPEYLELVNMGSAPVPLYDLEAPDHGWALAGAVDYAFPSGLVLNPGEVLLVCDTDPGAFAAAYDPPVGVRVLGPWTGQLDNVGERVKLVRPGPPEPTGEVPEILVEQVFYEPGSPWPVGAAGTGAALERVAAYAYGNDPANWGLSMPGGTPGLSAATYGHLRLAAGEAWAPGTPPGTIRWSAIPGETYRVERCDDLRAGAWVLVATFVAQGYTETVFDPSFSATATPIRSYRIRWMP